jgi:CO dehydrogenase maturation factor
MRIAFLGKGGSGKTTLTTAFIQLLRDYAHPVLAVDADVNVHLQEALGIEATGTFISNHFGAIASELEGKRVAFDELGYIPSIGTLPPTMQSTFIRNQPKDAFLQKYALQQEQVRLLTVGTYDPHDHGNACYHSKLTPLEFIFHHLIDRDDEYVIIDATAGTDPVSTSLIFAYDLLVCVVEPTHTSVAVFLDLLDLIAHWNIPLVAVGNKVQSRQDEAFLAQHIPTSFLLGFLRYSPVISHFEQGREPSLQPFVHENYLLFATLLQYSRLIKRDWTLYLARLRQLYIERCHSWYNAYYGRDLTLLIDPLFSYEQVLALQEQICIA